MRNLLRSRRGSVAFATVVALVPLIGALALGGEAGSWYVTKQHAQNAADAAAYSGGLRLACSVAGGVGCDTAQDYVYRGKQFAAQNSFCNAGDTSYPGSRCPTNLPSGTTQTVQIASLASWNGTSGNFVQATVSQQQPAYLAKVLGMSTVTINATAVAEVQNPIKPCVLALGGPIIFQDNHGPACGFASNFAGPGAIDFTQVSGSPVGIGLSTAVGGCAGPAALCAIVRPYSQPVADPYTALNAALSTLNLPACVGSAPVAYTTATPCANKNFNSSQPYTLSGTYFFSGTEFTMKGSANFTTVATGATIILLPGATTGKSDHLTLTIKAPNATPAALPASLQPYAALIGATAIYNTETDAQKFKGSTNITVNNGIQYYPNQTFDFSGNPNMNINGCSELIAKKITLEGSMSFTQNGCPQSAKPLSQVVKLVQ
ncbi:pilus assembly protein TadG-related protein [Bradyrhizobium sp. SSUT77]|uniref:pilus assembly protein TadG-related protein n=1 Tax=Bradyrhizobium sp. SSUT77 TaxID=3040603 RepID=UPI002447B3F5|nr:pilus assembly protein TadG-related protein [Bradyrhizobium sp. SSUT77]MDH2348683.1 pilus assembly protein TadG-related protein [Bradyrhizobium sp. SSUT77]